MTTASDLDAMSEASNMPALDFTGERFTPECVREIWYEHWHRYAFAMQFARGKRVLDAACGEGYGSAMLARDAASVLGLDISGQSIAHALQRYGDAGGRLRFATADVTQLDLPDASFDLIVSFETLEHVQEQEAMVAGFARLLRPDGVLLISSPDKANYSDAAGHDNPYHVRELYRAEFERLLAAHFPARRLLAQKLLFQSVMWDVDRTPSRAVTQTLDANGVPENGLCYPPLYYLAICAVDPLVLGGADPTLYSFGDVAESVYAHYNQEIRRIISAGQQIQAMDAEIVRLRAELEQLRGR